MTIENQHREKALVTSQGALFGFGVGVVMVAVLLGMDHLGLIEIDFSKRTNRTLFGLPIVTAVCLPLLTEATNRILGHLFSTRRRYGVHAQAHDPDAAALAEPRAEVVLTDNDFLPSDKALQTYETVNQLETSIRQQLAEGGLAALYAEDLRLFVQCRLYQGQSQQEVENELIAWGLTSQYAIGMVSSTRRVGRSGPIGEDVSEHIGDVAVGHWSSVTGEGDRQLAARADRRERLARRIVAQSQPANATPAANADLDFDPKAAATIYAKQATSSLCWMLIVGGLLVFIAAYLVFMMVAE